jgi:hypothetical protein
MGASKLRTELCVQDETLNELLPFGEYVPPERLAASAPHFMVGLDAWELEHLLHRLAAANTMGGLSARRDRRRHRSHTHASSSGQDRHSVGAPAFFTRSQARQFGQQ